MLPKSFFLSIVFFSHPEEEEDVVKGSFACCSYHADSRPEVERLGIGKFPYSSKLVD